MHIDRRDHRVILLGTADTDLAPRLRAELWKMGEPAQFSLAFNMAQVRAQVGRLACQLIVLEDPFLERIPVVDTLRQLTAAAPLILLVRPERLSLFARPVIDDGVECVTRAGEFTPLLSAMIARRIRWEEKAAMELGHFWGSLPADFGDVLRHEINNPLTGILGNAEMLLAHRERLPASATQRIETIVDLAVRLRETVRRLSQACEAKSRRTNARSA